MLKRSRVILLVGVVALSGCSLLVSSKLKGKGDGGLSQTDGTTGTGDGGITPTGDGPIGNLPYMSVHLDRTGVGPGENVTATITVQNFRLRPDKIGLGPEPGEGHFVIYRGGATGTNIVESGVTTVTFQPFPNPLPDGIRGGQEVEFLFVLVNNNSTGLDPEVSQSHKIYLCQPNDTDPRCGSSCKVGDPNCPVGVPKCLPQDNCDFCQNDPTTCQQLPCLNAQYKCKNAAAADRCVEITYLDTNQIIPGGSMVFYLASHNPGIPDTAATYDVWADCMTQGSSLLGSAGDISQPVYVTIDSTAQPDSCVIRFVVTMDTTGSTYEMCWPIQILQQTATP